MVERTGRDPKVRLPDWAVLVPAALGTMLAPLNSTMIAVGLLLAGLSLPMIVFSPLSGYFMGRAAR